MSSRGDFESVQNIARKCRSLYLCACSCGIKDIDAAVEALAPAAGNVAYFYCYIPIHMEHKLKISPDEVLKAVEMVGYARKQLLPMLRLIYSEDAGRSERSFFTKIIKAIDAGAIIINVPDTVGYTTPTEFGA